MKFRQAALVTTGFLLVLAGCSQSAPDTREADTKAIKDIETRWNAEFKAKDVDKILAHYADDAVLMGPGSPAASTPDARKAAWKALTDEATSVDFRATSVEAAKSGDLAASRGTYTMTLTDPATHQAVTDHGSYVTVYKKQADGNWKAVSDINVSEVPPVAPAATKSARRQGKKKRK